MNTRGASSLLVFCVLSLLILARPAAAQDKAFATRGVVEVAGSISFSSITPVSNGKTSEASSIFSFGPQIAYFPIDGLAIGFNPGITLFPGISVLTPPQGDNTTMVQLFFYPGYNYRIPASPTALFIEVPLGYTSMSSGSTTMSGFSWGVKGGVKVVASGHVLITIFGEYLAVTLNPTTTGSSSTSERNGFNYVSFGIGVGGFF